MKLKDILAIGGRPGLYRYIAQSKNGIIAESLTEKKRIPVYTSDKVSALEDIAIFTETDEVKLSEVFSKIFEKENGGKAIDPKSSGDQLKEYFGELLPDYDRERVYTSDIKKVFSWYNQLHDLDMLNIEEEEAGEENEEITEKKEEIKSEEKVNKTKKENGEGKE